MTARGGDSERGALMTLEGSKAVAIDVEPVRHLNLAAGPEGKPVAVYDRCKAGRCTYFLYDCARRSATLPAHTEAAVPVGAKRVVAATCRPSDDWCRLVLRSVTYRSS
jgi:hypothetical protein